MKKIDAVELDDNEIDAIKAIIDDFENEDRSVRERQIRDWKRLELMWCGFNNIYWDYVAHDWRIWGSEGGGDDNQSSYYDKNINVYRAYLETIIATLSNTVPPIKCLPDDADNVNDILTAKGGTKIAELVYNHIDAPLIWVKMLWTMCQQGMVAAYNYTDEDKEYGTVEVQETEDQEVDSTQKMCPSCGMVLDEQANNISEQEQNEYDPDNDDIILHDSLNENQLFCPQCQMDVDPELNANKIVVTRLVGITDQPKSRQCLEIYGGLYVKIPNWAKNQEDCPYLSLNYETHYSNIYKEYPELIDELPDGMITSPDGNSTYERWGRLSPEYRGEYPVNCPTVRNWWLRNSAFNTINEESTRKSLKKKFPDGCHAILVNDTWVKACNQNLDDHWTLLKNPLTSYVHYNPLGTLVTAIQEITNNLVSLEMQCIEHSIPITFFNPQFVNSEQFRNTEVSPGSMYPTKTMGQNRNISDGFHQLQSTTVSSELAPFGAKINEMGQFVSGALPQVFGGAPGAGSRTASQYAMQRNGAQQRLSNLTGRDVNMFWRKIFGKIIPAYIKNMMEDERLVQTQGKESFVNVIIKKAQLEGKLGDIRLEAPEGLPATIEQIKETVMTLMQTNNPEILAAIGAPENMPTLSKVLGLTDFSIPGEEDREKQYDEISKLLNSSPVPSIDQMGQPTEQPSVMPELEVDNHQIEAEICRNWLVSEKGRQAKTDSPDGYKNILLHLQIHMQMLQQLSAPQIPPQDMGNGNGKLKGNPAPPQ